jgi:hypothetical protein
MNKSLTLSVLAGSVFGCGFVARAQEGPAQASQTAEVVTNASEGPGKGAGEAAQAASLEPSASLSVTAWAVLSADFDSGGDVSSTFGEADFSASFPVGGSSERDAEYVTFGASVLAGRYDFSEGAFSPPVLPPTVPGAPWDTLYRMDVSLGYRGPISGSWGFTGGVSIASSFEAGAEFEDTLTFGGLAGVTYAYSQTLIVGGAVSVSTRLEDDVRVLPLPFIIWSPTSNIIINSGPSTGPAGPGVSFTYVIDSNWTAGASVGFRTLEARLDDDGVVAGGVGRHSMISLLANVGWRATDAMTVRAYAGYTFSQQFELLGSDGTEFLEDDAKGAPVFGAMVEVKF